MAPSMWQQTVSRSTSPWACTSRTADSGGDGGPLIPEEDPVLHAASARDRLQRSAAIEAAVQPASSMSIPGSDQSAGPIARDQCRGDRRR
jgi:hypothetical protein